MKFNNTVALIGGADLAESAFETAQIRAKYLVGADGGGDAILRHGLLPAAVIGDMDSLSAEARAAIPPERLVTVAEQDSTDFEKALGRIEAPLILAAGFTGARLDHELAALHGLVRFPRKPVILVGAEDITLHLPARIALDLPERSRVSLFPLDAVTLGLTGLEWSFEALELHPAGRIGTSNAVKSGPVRLTSDRPGCLLILPRAALDAAIAALAEADFHSPPAGAAAKGIA